MLFHSKSVKQEVGHTDTSPHKAYEYYIIVPSYQDLSKISMSAYLKYLIHGYTLSLNLSLSNTLTITFSLIWRRAILDIRLRPPCFFLWSISTSPTRWDEIVWNVLIVKRTNFLILIFQLPSMRWWSIWLFKLQVSVFN